eukprot:XP_001700937.1 hypothetical protein CHLREDRAFT_187405 [Chlamydomonas reinhardtii]
MQLKLSPFSLTDLAAALLGGRPSELLDELFVTWPEYVWEWLELSGDKTLIKFSRKFDKEELAARAARIQGGNLLCCDRCPAAYHMRCIGETTRSVPEGEWRCPECAVGGRGMRPLVEDGALVGLGVALGRQAEQAVRELAGAKAKAGSGSGSGPGSSKAILVAVAAAADPDAYVNKYRSAWTAFVAAMKATHDLEYKKSKRAGATPASLLAVPLPLPNFNWPLVQASGAVMELVAEGRMGIMQHFLLVMEKELWGLLGGGWALGGGRGADFRRAWVRAVREAEGPAQLAPRLLEIEAALPMSLPVLPVSWDPYRRDPAELALLERVAAERRREADSYRRRRITSLMPTSKKGRAKKAMPAHLQAWNNLRASQAAAAKATKTPKEAQEGGDSEAAGVSRWVPAEAVPLWLVKAFEERARTEAAERGAGASGAAGGSCAITFATCPGLAAAGWVSCASASASCLAGCHAACLGLTPREAEGPAASRAKWLCDLMLEPCSRDFMTPVDVSQVVPRPMDLGSVLAGLRRGAYARPADVAGDVGLVAANCAAYNEPGSGIVAQAEHLGLEAMRVTMAEPRAAPFLRPVKIPGYEEIIEMPMDLGTILRRLTSGYYSTTTGPLHMLDDVRLVWSNCRRFNEPGSPIIGDCEHVRSVFNRAWQKAPGYLDVITRPMDLGTVLDNLRRGAYPSGAICSRAAPDSFPFTGIVSELDYDQRAGIRELGVLGKRCLARPGLIAGKYDYLGDGNHATLGKLDFAALQADVEQIWANCRTYNNKSSRVFKLGEQPGALQCDDVGGGSCRAAAREGCTIVRLRNLADAICHNTARPPNDVLSCQWTHALSQPTTAYSHTWGNITPHLSRS